MDGAAMDTSEEKEAISAQDDEHLQDSSDSDGEPVEKKSKRESSSSDSDSDDDSENDVDRAEIEEIEKQVEASPYLYDQHVKLIQLLKTSGDLERVRLAHERMRKIYPLTEELWLDWLRDEANIAISDEEKERLCKLFDEAVKDYLSIEVWLEYCQFSIGCMGMKDGLEKCRGVFERAVMCGGLHVTKGNTLWEAYREFEIALLDTLQFKENKSAEDEEKATQQAIRLMNVFKRQLSVPLLGMEKTYEEFLELSDESVDANTNLDYKKVLTKLSVLRPFEDKLLQADPPRLNAFQEYIDFEIKQGEPSRIQCIFERALVDNCLIPELWKRYTDYLDHELKIECIVLPVYERAIRNCPWSLPLWQGYLRALERYKQPLSKIKEITEKALSAGFTTPDEVRELWLTYLTYLRRQINWNEDHADQLEVLRAAFERATKHLSDSFSESGDPLCLIPQFWAKIEAKYCNNMDKSREIWSDIMYSGHSQHAQMWIEYINLERVYGSPKALRKVFIRALQASSDWTESIGEAWLNFERDEGTLEQWEYASSKCEARLKVLKDVREKADVVSIKRETHKKVGNDKLTKGSWKNQSKTGDSKANAPNRKKRKFDQEDSDTGSSSSTNLVDSEGFKVPVSPSVKSKIGVKESTDALDPSKTSTEIPSSEETGGKKKTKHDSTKDERTVFVSNLLFDLPEEKIRETFSKVGEITDIRVAKDFKGRSRGYAYVEFKCWDMALEALKMDRELIGGRPVFVSKSEDRTTKSSGPKFKFSTGLEKNKLFVRGLPFSLTKEQLEELLKPFGALKETRLVTFRNGNPKGLAFVEFNDEAAAALAVLKMDGFVIDGHTISVAISNPPERGARGGESDGGAGNSRGSISSLGGGKKDVGPRGRGRTQVSLLPRSVARSKPVVVKSEAAKLTAMDTDEYANGKSQSNGGVGGADSKTMSNSDFRQMLLQ